MNSDSLETTTPKPDETVTAYDLSCLLLTLYNAAHESNFKEFPASVLDLIRRHIAFDAAWWSFDTVVEGKHCTYSSFTINMPDGCEDLLNQLTKSDNIVFQACSALPGRTFKFNADQLSCTFSSAWLSWQWGTKSLLCTTHEINKSAGLMSSLALVRRDQSPPFSEQDRLLNQILMPHLGTMRSINQTTQLARERTHEPGSRLARAVIDLKGILHTVEPGFASVMKNEWPGWQGPTLPQGMLDALTRGKERFVGNRLVAHFVPAQGLVMVTIYERSRFDDLAPREMSVAQAYARGRSYKEIAKDLQISPTTVRFHLRTIYEKLQIGSKAELASQLASTAAESLRS